MSIFEAVRILDLTRLLPGAYCSLLFADLGAEVIKIEEPGVGDYARWASPALEATSQGAGFEMLNRNKKSLTLNLKDESGKAILRRLVESADVLLESFRPGVMERLGLGYETLRQINSRLVYCAISGYGQHGPYRDLAGHDINYLGYAGALSITGPREGPPVLPGVQVADIGGGSLLAAFTIAAALYHRNQSGRGQMLDVSMTDGAISWLGYQFGVFFATGKAPARGDERLNGGVPCYGVYPTKDDKYLTVGALEPKFWQKFCQLIGHEALIPHQYATGTKRDEVEADLRAIFRTRTREEWLALFKGKDVCVGPVLDFDEVVHDPHVQHRGLFQTIQHSSDKIRQVAFPVQLSETPAGIRELAPQLGEHTEDILKSLGYTSEEVVALRQRGVI